MKEIDVTLPSTRARPGMARAVERACASEGLTLTLKGTLAAYPGCVHWHFKKGAQRGTLEITWWPGGRRLWFKVSAGRTGDWMGASIRRLRRALEAR